VVFYCLLLTSALRIYRIGMGYFAGQIYLR